MAKKDAARAALQAMDTNPLPDAPQPTVIIHPASVDAPLPVDMLFDPACPLEVDCGCGKGRFLLARATAHPQVQFLGIDRMLGRIRKLITHMMKSTGIDMPPDILDDSTVAQAVGGAQPMSQPIGQDSSSQQPPSLPAMGGQGAVQPIQPPDAGGAGGGQQKQGSVASLFQGPVSSDMNTFTQRMDALAALSRSLGRM